MLVNLQQIIKKKQFLKGIEKFNKRVSSGLSAIGNVVQYAPFPYNILGYITQIPDLAYDVKDIAENNNINNKIHLGLDLSSIGSSFDDILNIGGKFSKVNNVIGGLAAFDDAYTAITGDDVIDLFKNKTPNKPIKRKRNSINGYSKNSLFDYYPLNYMEYTTLNHFLNPKK